MKLEDDLFALFTIARAREPTGRPSPPGNCLARGGLRRPWKKRGLLETEDGTRQTRAEKAEPRKRQTKAGSAAIFGATA